MTPMTCRYSTASGPLWLHYDDETPTSADGIHSVLAIASVETSDFYRESWIAYYGTKTYYWEAVMINKAPASVALLISKI